MPQPAPYVPEPPAPEEIPQPSPPEPPKRRALAALAAAGGVLLLKLKGVLALAKAVPLGKLALTSLSMLTMVFVEAQRGGVAFAVGFVLLIFVHEMGHAYAIRRAGLSAGWPVFIPFVGALIALQGTPQSPSEEAEIAYAGPLAGTAASLACAALAIASGSRLFLSLAYTGFFLNLFNLIPISPLDGGRVAQAFSGRAWIVGGLLLGAMFLVTQAPQLLMIGAFAAMRAFQSRGAAEHAPTSSTAPTPPTPPTSEEDRKTWMTRYFGLCFFLGAAIYFSKRLLSPAG